MTGTHESILDFTDLMASFHVKMTLQGFDTRWDEVLLSLKELLQDNIFESLYRLRIREFEQLKTVLAICNKENEQMGLEPSYRKLKDHREDVLGSKVSESRF